MSDALSDRSARDDLAPPDAQFDPIADVFIGVGDGAPTDNTPTIISKNQPRPDKPKSTANPARHGPDSNFGNSIRGRTLAHFELIEPIGVGGMAAVLRARDKQLDRTVALKILPPEMATDPENVKRFHQEARAAAKLDHENIARVYFCGEDQRLHFIAFEFVEGSNLRALLEKRGRLPVAEAVHYLLQIAAGLAHAASRGVVHRDIKPSNIIISSNGRAKLVDMGLARSLEKHADRDLTQSGVTLGTFDYISPEQALEPRDADVRSDIYSLGCTFYHMLTGHPPVPEGTAAKKLHHHQHVAPVDPRQLNAEIPDEVAAILVRMMAKDPKDRYQRAEHLVQHLIQVAQKLGGTGEMPDGVLFVDAPLPSAPRRRPLLTAAVAALVLGLFLILRTVAVPPSDPVVPPQPAQKLPTVNDGGEPGANLVIDQEKSGQAKRRVGSLKELTDALAEKEPPAEIVLTQSIALPATGVVFRGRVDFPVVIESEKAGNPVTLTFTHVPGENKRDFWAGLTVESGILTLRNVRVEVEARETPAVPVAGVAVTKSGVVWFRQCTFTQKTPPPPLISNRDLVPVASVLGWNKTPTQDKSPQLDFEECFFERGQTAVALTGTVSVVQAQCALGPHGPLFHLRGQKDLAQKSDVKLTNVSAHLVYGPAFRLDEGATCKLSVTYCIFSCTDTDKDSRNQPDLIHQRDTGKVSFLYEGRRNCYYGLNAFLVRPGKDNISRVEQWDGFRQAIQNDGRDEGSVQLSVTPWERADPTALLTKPVDVKDAKLAFRINLELPALRQRATSRLLGVEQCVWGPTHDKVESLSKPKPFDVATYQLKPHEKLVDASVNVPGIFSTVAGAVMEAKSGDVIYIKDNGKPIEVDPVQIQGKKDITLRPFQDSKPVLTLGTNATEYRQAALFRLHHGTIRFEQLSFLLTPALKYDHLAVVAVTGNGGCHFKQCQVTLAASDEPNYKGVPLSAVALLEGRDAMQMGMMDTPSPMPVVRWQESVVRGQGDFLCVKGSRLFDLDVDACLVAVTGSLLNVESNSVGVADKNPEAKAKVTLTHVTALVHDHLLSLRAGKTGRGLTPTKVTANHNLFVGVSLKPMVHLEGAENEEQLTRLLKYQGNHNAYCGFDKQMEVSPNEDTAPVPALDYNEPKAWRGFTGETAGDMRTGPFPFERSRGAEQLHESTPDDFKVKADPKLDLQGYGAPLEQLPREKLMMPMEEEAQELGLFRRPAALDREPINRPVAFSRCAGTAA